MPPKIPPRPVNPKRWRICAVAADGLRVTLGRYDTREEADADFRRLATSSAYRNVVIEPLAVAPATEGEGQTR